MTGAELARSASVQIRCTMVGANLLGALVVYVFLSYLLPTPVDEVDAERVQQLNTVGFVLAMPVSLVVGNHLGDRAVHTVHEWLTSGRDADDLARRAALRLPLLLLRNCAVLWLAAAVAFGLLNLTFSGELAKDVAATIALGGVTTSALAYLLTERLLRPIVTEAFRGQRSAPPVVLGVRPRLLLAWALGTGVPVLGIVLGVLEVGEDVPLGSSGVLFLAGVALCTGLLAISAASRAVADPVRSVADALGDVAQGRLDVHVPVYDASEVGRLQAGFNAMVEGLRERERLRDLFGRQVGEDVARDALERGVQLGGERREAAALFVDVVGSTALAERETPEVVVQRLNAFFGVVVEVVTAHGGWVNKFEGDGALCVFGAPVARDDAASCALSAARTLARRLRDLPLDAAVGVAAGQVVAGHVGAESRFEYTVVGDPVNAAARLCELAKGAHGCVLADAATVERAGDEAAHWEVCGEEVLRGRTAPTRLARPT